MANVLNEEKKQQVLALGRLGWSLRQIQQATRIRRETASQYLKAAGIAVRLPGGWGRRAPKPANEVITDFGAEKPAITAIIDPNCSPKNLSTKGKATSKPANEVITDSEVITDPNLSQRDEVGALPSEQVASPQILSGRSRDHHAGFRGSRPAQLAHEALHALVAAGETVQVDYGTGPMVLDPETRKYRRTRLFVMTLGCSRKAIRLLTFRSSARIWAELHERAFRRLGGSTRIVVLDNLREGVLVPDIYDPALNPLYRDVLAHYGAIAMPCRIQDPDRKGKVESGIGHTQKTPLKGLRFESLEEAQAYLDRWEERWADTRIHGTTKRQVAAMFVEEKPSLLPLPVEPFRYYQYGDIRQQDRTKRTPLRVSQLLWRASRAGANIGTLCDAIHRHQGEVGVRRILGVLSLAKKFGVAAVDDACSAALEMGVQEYRFVRRYLERCPQAPLTLQQVDPLIRELVQYRDLINYRTKEQENESH